jgi:ribonuclease VapC
MMRTVPFDRVVYEVAGVAFDQFGRGRHWAELGFDNCLAYAVAKFHDVPLLFKGDDSPLTDIRPVLP